MRSKRHRISLTTILGIVLSCGLDEGFVQIQEQKLLVAHVASFKYDALPATYCSEGVFSLRTKYLAA